MLRWAKRVFVGVACLVVLGVFTGAEYELIMRARVARRYPPPGRLVDIGGRRIQLDCRGSGSPTVVLESGLDHLGSLSWALVHDSLATTTRVCAYSRAGMMWSDPAQGPFDSRTAAGDLHSALAKAGESPPWVMVGHSLGGPYIMTFTSLYGSEVAGLVFVDASHPDQVERFHKATGKRLPLPTGVLAIGSALAWTGIVRLVQSGQPPSDWPPIVRAEAPAYLPTSIGALLRESRALDATLETAGHFRQLGDRPLVVLTAMAKPAPGALEGMGLTEAEDARRLAAWKELHDDEATWSSHSRHELVPDAFHYIQFERPDVVIRAVREVVAALRQEHPVPPAQ